MKAGIAIVRKELTGIYSREEIESFIFLIFEKLKGHTRTQFLLAREEILNEEELSALTKIVFRLKNHEPIQYVLGETEFYGLPFYTAPGVLIPRPETEELVQWIIQENEQSEPVILDIGTGTGCIAISLSKNIREATVLACDISQVCIETAQRNAKINSVGVVVFEFDILNENSEISMPELDIIVSNPPYIRENEKFLMEKNVLDFEPGLALFVPNENPLLFYNRIADFALLHLKNQGKLYFEINEAFGDECRDLLIRKGFTDVVLKKDINGKDRMVCSTVSHS